jgi:hypothetical protein
VIKVPEAMPAIVSRRRAGRGRSQLRGFGPD